MKFDIGDSVRCVISGKRGFVKISRARGAYPKYRTYVLHTIKSDETVTVNHEDETFLFEPSEINLKQYRVLLTEKIKNNVY